MNLSVKDVEKILAILESQHMLEPGDVTADDVSCIVYRHDMFECGREILDRRHIDIEFPFGEFLEIHENTPAFDLIIRLFDIPHPRGVLSTLLYRKQDGQLPHD